MKKLFLILFTICMIFMSACSVATENATTPATKNVDMADITESIPETPEVVLSEEEIYHNFLLKLHKKLNAIIGDDTHLDGFSSQEGMVGVAEIASISRTGMLKKIGYTMLDITGDNIPELLICAIDELTDASCKGTRILCAFSASANETQLLYAGNLLNRYYLLDDATLYNEIFNGAMTVVAGVYQPVSGSNSFQCVDFYFVDFDKDDKPHFYHNQSEKLDVSVSNLLEGGEETYGKIVEGFTERIQILDLMPMESFQN